MFEDDRIVPGHGSSLDKEREKGHKLPICVSML